MIIQAFQSLHSHGFLKIQSGVDVSGLPLPTSVKESGNHAPLARAIVDPSLLDWFTIDKNTGETLQTGVHPPRKQGTRSFMPASADCFRLFRQIEVALKDCGLANSHHDINLSRGASWVRSKSIPSRGLPQQTIHFDYDTTRVGYDRLQLPMSLRFTSPHPFSCLLTLPVRYWRGCVERVPFVRTRRSKTRLPASFAVVIVRLRFARLQASLSPKHGTASLMHLKTDLLSRIMFASNLQLGAFFQWLLSQNLTGEQFHAAHQTFKKGVSSTNAVPKKKVNAIMNAIAEVIQSPVWQWNSDGSSRYKRAQIAFHAKLHQNHELVPAFPCTKCSHGVGIVVRCSGYPKPCENHFHVGCAASFVEQSKTRFKRYYCDSCSLSIHQRQFKQKKKQAKPVRPKAAGKHKSQQGRNLSNDSATKDSVSGVGVVAHVRVVIH